MNSDLGKRLALAGHFDDGELSALTETLARDAGADLDVAYRVIGSPVGDLLLAATHTGLVRVAFDIEGHDAVLADLATRLSPRILRAPARLDAPAHALEAYFTGRSQRLDIALDRRLSGSGFRGDVQRLLTTLTYGTTSSYAELAAAAGRPAAVRAVGTACATNPLPIVVPCHRVVRSDGSFGNYLGGYQAKVWLLNFEQSQQVP